MRRFGIAFSLMMSLVVTGGGFVAGSVPAASASIEHLCTGYAACRAAGYTTHGYDSQNSNSYWGAFAGHNCTNYAAYVMSLQGTPAPDYQIGNATAWAANARAHGVVVDGIPTVGAVAHWPSNSGGVSSDGHVAVVEEVDDGYIIVSEDAWQGDFHWAKISPGSGYPLDFIHFSGGGTHTSIVRNGGFEAGGASWSMMPNSNFVSYSTGQVSGETARSGTNYAATNTSQPGGGIYQDITGLRITPGTSYCASAHVRTQIGATGASGVFAVWLLGGALSEPGERGFSNLGVQDNWVKVDACVTATIAHDAVRIQFYPTPGAPTLDIDDVDLHASLAANAGFEAGGASWNMMPNSNFVSYSAGQVAGESARSGTNYAATNTTQPGGGIYQDITGLHIVSGTSYCASAQVRTQIGATGASGMFVVWLLGGASNEPGTRAFSNLGSQDNWTSVDTCVTATTSHSAIRVQFYPDAGSPTLDIDDVDVHASLTLNAGFEAGGASWSMMPNSNFVSYNTGQVVGEAARTRSHYGATNTSQPGGGIYQDITGLLIVPGDTFCASAYVRTQIGATGASGMFVVWLLGGASNEQGTRGFSNLASQDNWTSVDACVTATTPHSAIRVQFYPDANSPTLDIDDVDVH